MLPFLTLVYPPTKPRVYAYRLLCSPQDERPVIARFPENLFHKGGIKPAKGGVLLRRERRGCCKGQGDVNRSNEGKKQKEKKKRRPDRSNAAWAHRVKKEGSCLGVKEPFAPATLRLCPFVYWMRSIRYV